MIDVCCAKIQWKVMGQWLYLIIYCVSVSDLTGSTILTRLNYILVSYL